MEAQDSSGPDSELSGLSQHMLAFGVSLVGHGVYHILISGRGSAPFGTAFGIVHIGHGCELIIKAAIAKEHPLLIFSKTPGLRSSEEELSVATLLREGRTLTYSQLPDQLWAATGFKITSIDTYDEFGRLRNSIQHCAVPEVNFSKQSMQYLCEVVDPVLQNFWNQGVFEAMYEAWDEQDPYVFCEDIIRDALAEANITYGGWLPEPGTEY